MNTFLSPDNLASGLIGSIIGASITYFIYYVSCWRTAKNNLIIKLISLKDYRFATIEGVDSVHDTATLYKNSFSEVYGLFLTYRSTFPCFRRQTEKIWKKYAGTEGNDFMTETQHPVYSGGDATQRIDALLKEIGYK